MRMCVIPEEHLAAVQQAAVEFEAFDATLSVKYDAIASSWLKKKYWDVTRAFKYHVNDSTWVYIPAGYLTDGASVPRPLWWLLPPWGKYGQAAVVHDQLCETLEVYVGGVPTPITRARADAIFREAMKAAHVSPFVRNVMYWAVRAYAVICHKTKPTIIPLKDELEAKWQG